MLYAIPAPDQSERFYNFEHASYTLLSRSCLLPSRELAQMYAFVMQNDEDSPIHEVHIRQSEGYVLFHEDGYCFDFTSSELVSLLSLHQVGLLPTFEMAMESL